MALPYVACTGLQLHQKPLDTAIGRLLTLYCPGGRPDNSKQNNIENDAPTVLTIFLAVAVCG